MRMPLRYHDQIEGSVVFGAKQTGLPFTEHEANLLESAAGYLAASLNLAQRSDQQAAALETLSASARQC